MVGNGGESDVCGAGWVLVSAVDCVCVWRGGEGGGVVLTELDDIDDDLVCGVHRVVEACGWMGVCV